jgi:hypothetical protein
MSPPKNANPGAGGARAHGISKSDAVPTTRNQLAAQSTATLAATTILTAALKRGGTDGDEILMLAPLRMPRDVRRWFEIWLNEFRAEVIAIIQADAAARTGERVPDAIDTERVS